MCCVYICGNHHRAISQKWATNLPSIERRAAKKTPCTHAHDVHGLRAVSTNVLHIRHKHTEAAFSFVSFHFIYRKRFDFIYIDHILNVPSLEKVRQQIEKKNVIGSIKKYNRLKCSLMEKFVIQVYLVIQHQHSSLNSYRMKQNGSKCSDCVHRAILAPKITSNRTIAKNLIIDECIRSQSSITNWQQKTVECRVR